VTRIFPPQAKLNLALGSFQLEKDSSVVGTFRLSSSSSPATASVNSSTGLVTLHNVGTVTVELVDTSGKLLADSRIEIVNPQSPQLSYIDSSAEYVLSFFQNNEIAKDDFAVIFPILYFSDQSFSQGLSTYYSLSFSVDGFKFYTEAELNQIPYIQLDKNYNQAGLFGFKISCIHATDSVLTVRVTYQDSGSPLVQDFKFSLTGPARITYTPFYHNRGFEIDLGTTISLGASVLTTNGNYLESAVFESKSPDILEVQSNGYIYPLRSTQTDYLSYSDNKAALRVFTEVSGNLYAVASNKLYQFNNGTYTNLLDFTYNLRALGTAEDAYILTYVSYQQESFPFSRVYKINLAKPKLVQEEVAYVTEVATAFSSVKLKDGTEFCLLATRYLDQSVYPELTLENIRDHGYSKIYKFSYNNDSLRLSDPFSTNTSIIKKIIPGPDGYAYLLYQYGDIELLNLTDGTYTPLMSTNAAETIAAIREDSSSFWRYTSDNRLYKVKISWINDDPATPTLEGFYVVTENVDYGTLNTPSPSAQIYQASYIDGLHYLVFANTPVTTQSFSDAIFPQENIEPNPANTVNTRLGILDLSKPVVGVARMYSPTDNFIQTTASFLIHPSNTKRAYFLKYTGSVINLPSETSNLLPVQIVFSDNTFSYADSVTNVNQTDGLSLSKVTGSSVYQDEVYATANKELESQLKFSTKFNTSLSKTIPTNFYPAPIDVKIKNRDNSQNGFNVKLGQSLEIPTYILLSGNRVYEKPLKLEGWDSNKISVKSGTNITVSGLGLGNTSFNYRTPQPLDTYVQGSVYIYVDEVAKPSYINFLSFSDNTVVVPYKLDNSLVGVVSVTGEVVYSDNTTLAPNTQLNWQVVGSGTGFTAENGNQFKYTYTSGVTPSIATGLAVCSLGTSVTRSFYLYPLLVEDLTYTEIVVPDYVARNNNFIRYSDIPSGRLDFYVRQANGAFIYGNPLLTFTLDNNVFSSAAQGTLTTVSATSFGVAKLTVSLSGTNLAKDINIQFGGPQYITSLLPYYLLDVGKTGTYFSGTIYNNNNEPLINQVTLVKASSNTDEMSSALVGKLRGKFARAISEDTVNKIIDISDTYELTLATLDGSGFVSYIDRFNTVLFKEKVQHGDNVNPVLVDFYRPEFGLLVFDSGNDSIIYKRDTPSNTPNFVNWGTLSGNKVTDITSYRDTVYLVVSGTVRTISRNELVADNDKLGTISGITGVANVSRDLEQVFCTTTTSGNGYLNYDDDNPSDPPRQMYSGAKSSSTGFALLSDGRTINNAEGGNLGQVPAGLTLLSAGYKFFFVDSATGKKVYAYEPYNTYSLKTVFTAQDYSAATYSEVATTILTAGSAKDYFISYTTKPSRESGLIYIGDEVTLTPKVYNSDGSVHTRADLYVAGIKITSQENDGSYKVKITSGGYVAVKWVSKADDTVFLESTLTVRRRVKAIRIKNYIDANNAIAVNVDRTVPLKAFVEYEDGFTDTQLITSLDPSGGNFYKQQNAVYLQQVFINGQLYLKGLSVTPATSPTIQIKPIETELADGINSVNLTLIVKVHPPGSRILSTLYAPESLSVFEQSTSPAGVELFYTDGSTEELYNEGFQTDIDGAKIFTETLVDLAINSSDEVYLLKSGSTAYSIDVFDRLGIYKRNYTLPTGNTYNLVRVLDSRIFVSTKSAIFELVNAGLSGPIYGDNTGESTYNIADFKVSSSGYQILDLGDTTNKKVVKLNNQGEEASATVLLDSLPSDLIGFGQFANSDYYFISAATNILKQDGATLITSPNISGYTQFQDEIFFATQHRVNLGLSNSKVSTLAGSPFVGFYNGQGTAARFSSPTKLAVDSRRRVYVIDSGNKTLRRITDGYAEALVGGFWETTKEEQALGLGPLVVAKKPGVDATLTVSYLGMEEKIKVTVKPVYDKIVITNTEYTAYLNSNTKSSLDLKYQIYTLSGPIPSDQTLVDEIKYPPTGIWSSTIDAWIENQSKFKPDQEGIATVFVKKTDPLGSNEYSTNANFFCVPLAPTGLVFDKDFYKTQVNAPLNLTNEVSLGYNDSSTVKRSDGLSLKYLTATGFDGEINPTINFEQEYDGTIRATYQSFVKDVPLYVYAFSLALSFTTTPFTVASGVSRRITAHHTPNTSLFHNKLITYSASDNISGNVSLSLDGVVTALSTSVYSGKLFAVSQLLGTTGTRPMLFDTGGTRFSQFDPLFAETKILHSGETIKLAAIPLSIINSSNDKVPVTLTKDTNFTLSGSAAVFTDLPPLEEGDPAIPAIAYSTTGTFTGVYTHSLDATPYSDNVEVYEFPYLAVSPTGIRITVNGTVIEDTVYLVAGQERNIKFEMAYEPFEVFDLDKDNPPVGGTPSAENVGGNLTITKLDDQPGYYNVSGAAITDSSTNQVDTSVTLTYKFDNNKSFKRDFGVTRFAVAERIEADHGNLEVLCLEALPETLVHANKQKLTQLTAKVYLSDNTEDTQKYKWVVADKDDKTVTLTPTDPLVLPFNSLGNGYTFYAEETTDTIKPAKKTQTCVFYNKLDDITNPAHAEYLAAKGLLSPYRTVKFEPKLLVELDLNSTMSSNIKAKAYTASDYANLNNVSATDISSITEPYYMFDSNKKAVFARRIHVLTTGTNVLFGDERCITYTVTEGDSLSVLRSTDKESPIDTQGTSYFGLVLKDGYVLYRGGTTSKIYAYTPSGTPFSHTLTASGLVYHTGNEFFAYTNAANNSLQKIVVDFATSTFDITNYAGITGAYSKLLVSPAESFRYLKSNGIYITSGSSLSQIITGNFSQAVMLNDNEFITVTTGAGSSYQNQIQYTNMSNPAAPVSWGEILPSLGTAITDLQLYSGNLLYAKVGTGKVISIDLQNATTEFTAKHPKNINLFDTLSVKVLAPPENRTYNLSLSYSPPVIKQDTSSITITGNSFNTNGVSTSATITVDSSYLRLDNTSKTYTALKPGSTIVTGVAGTLTGTLTIPIEPIPEEIVFTSDFLLETNSEDLSIILNSGSSIPFDAKVKYSDGTFKPAYLREKIIIIRDTDTEYLTGSSPIWADTPAIYPIIYTEGVLTTDPLQSPNVNLPTVVKLGFSDAIREPKLTSFIYVKVAPEDRVLATKFTLGASEIDLLLGDIYTIPATVYYSNGTTDNYISATSSDAGNVVVYGDTALKALKRSPQSVTVTVVPRASNIVLLYDPVANKFSITSRTLKVNVKNSFGVVEEAKENNKVIGVKIKSSALVGTPEYYQFKSDNLPTVTEINSPSLFDAPLTLALDKTNTILLFKDFKPLKSGGTKTAQLLFSLPPYTLTNNPYSYTVPQAIPTFEFDLSNLELDSEGSYIVKRGDVKTFTVYKRYDSQTREPFTETAGVFAEATKNVTVEFVPPRTKGEFKITTGKESTQCKITARFAGMVDAFFTLKVIDPEPSTIVFYKNQDSNYNPVDSITGFVFSDTNKELYFALADSTSTAVFLKTAVGTATVTGTGLNTVLATPVNPVDNRYFKFTYSGQVGAPLNSSIEATITYGSTTYTASLPVTYTPSRVTDLILTPYGGLTDSRTVFVGQPFLFTLEAVVVPKLPNNKARDYIKSSATNPYILSDVDFNDTGAYQLTDLIEFVYGSTVLKENVDFVIDQKSQPYSIISLNIQPESSIQKGALQPFVAKLKGQPLTSNSSFSIMIEEVPVKIIATSSDIEFFST